MRRVLCLVSLLMLSATSVVRADHWYEAERNAYFSSVPANGPRRLRPPQTACSPSYRPAYYGPPTGSPYGPALYQNQYVPNYLSNSTYQPGNYPVMPTRPPLFTLPGASR
jgi:hypothetical protein